MGLRGTLAESPDSFRTCFLGRIAIIIFLGFFASCGGGASRGLQSLKEVNSTGGSDSLITLNAPTISLPAGSPTYSNSSPFTISGACDDGLTVNLSGSAIQSTLCSSSAYSFTVAKSSDGSYAFTVKQSDGPNTSPGVSTLWVYDTTAPFKPTVASPAVNPFISSDTTVVLSGTCENFATVNLSGGATGSTICSGGNYNFSVSQSTDGTYDFSLTQVDRAGNVSLAKTFQWVRDTSLPSTPIISSPSGTPVYTNSSPLVVSGTCDSSSAHTVYLAGNFSGSTACSSSAFSLNANAGSDGTYIVEVFQENGSTLATSGSAYVTWIYDTLPPSAPVLVTPSSSPFTAPGPLTISGICENAATVELSGDESGTANCADSTFSFVFDEGVDATYNYTVTQTDRAGNVSSPSNLQWVRNSTALVTPVILTPTSNPLLGNLTDIELSGTCTTGLTVNLTGDDTQSVTCVSSYFSFNLSKSSDGIYQFSITQTNGVDVSSAASFDWTLDTLPPDVSIDSAPVDPNPLVDSQFAFSSTDGTAVFECQMDGGGYSACGSPMVYSALSNGSHTFNVRSVDLSGNLSTVSSYTWNQEAYNTIVLYHLNAGAPGDELLDESSYRNDLTNSSCTLSTAGGQFADGMDLENGTPSFLSVADSEAMSSASSVMSYEFFAKFESLPTGNGDEVILASQSGTMGNYGWVFGISKHGGAPDKYALFLQGSLDGSSMSVVKTKPFNLSIDGSYHHFAFTWNLGSATFFMDGANMGSKSIGAVGSTTLFDTSADFRIGRGEDNQSSTLFYFDGLIDEVRWSQTLRGSGSFAVPSSEYLAD